MPPSVVQAVWRADQLGTSACATLSSGFEALDAVLPGGGWPCRGVTELLCPQAGVLEWRLLGPALRARLDEDPEARLLLVAPPRVPHPPGLQAIGIDEQRLVWIDAADAAERLWVVEQLLRARRGGSVLLAWLPEVQASPLRRLQVLAGQVAGGGRAPVFVVRDRTAASASSPAPLRLLAWPGVGGDLHVDVLKRPGAPLERVLTLPAPPPALAALLPLARRQRGRVADARPIVVSASLPAACSEATDVVGCPVASRGPIDQRHAA